MSIGLQRKIKKINASEKDERNLTKDEGKEKILVPAKKINPPQAILENMYVAPENFGVAPGDLRRLLAYFGQIVGVA